MNPRSLDVSILKLLNGQATKLEKHFKADVVSYVGPIHPLLHQDFRTLIEQTKAKRPQRGKLMVFLNTSGGSAPSAEKMVDVIRQHYPTEVEFVVPDMAMSAGTILVMSGERIWMDYSSSLGPVDPQVEVRQPSGQTAYVPALGYLDKAAELIEKSKKNELTPIEAAMMLQLDLGNLRAYEQAKDLSVSLLKKWLVEYKFRTWTQHRTNNPETTVTPEQKETRAEEIAKMLCDNKAWHSHERYLGIGTLRDVVKLEIEDYSANDSLRGLIREYHDTLNEYTNRMQAFYALHSTAWSSL
jgi:ATP-dependent protease ClpP protease subunit